MSYFLAGLLSGLAIMAYFDRSVWMQARRVMYDMDYAGRARVADIKAKELNNINASRRAHGLEPVERAKK